MLRPIFLCFLFLANIPGTVKAQHAFELNKLYNNLPLHKTDTLHYQFRLQQGGVFQFTIEQLGIGVAYQLTDAGNHVFMKGKRPEDITGFLKSEFAPAVTGNYTLTILRYNDPENTDSGRFSIMVKSLGKAEIAEREKIKKELASENAKTVLTADIDHFWQTFDQLKRCSTLADSVTTFQKLYIDRATDGLKDFIAVRDLSAEKLVQSVARYPRFFASIRSNTYAVKKAEPVIEELFIKFKKLYPHFKPFKVCFAIGIVNTGGTVSGKFVLIGTEITTSASNADVSEFTRYKENNKAAILSRDEDLVQKIRNIVAHECVHTQQRPLADTATKCMLLGQVLKEGICDFIGEMVAGRQINAAIHDYGNLHEKQLWEELKANLCNGNMTNWLYNSATSTNRPADLGYYMGYRIARAYYQQATNKQQAIIDIIEMNAPMQFLQASRYSPVAF